MRELAPCVPRRYTLGMRKYLDIPLTVVVTTVLTIAMLWPLEAPHPAPAGSDKLVHFIAFAALAFPLARTGRLGLLPVFIGASAFGAIIELIQPTFNRSTDVKDLIGRMGVDCHEIFTKLGTLN